MDRNAAMASSSSASRFSSSTSVVSDHRHGGQAQEKPHVRLIRMVRDQGPKDRQSLGEAVALDQHASSPNDAGRRTGGTARATLGPGEQTGHSAEHLDEAGTGASGDAERE